MSTLKIILLSLITGCAGQICVYSCISCVCINMFWSQPKKRAYSLKRVVLVRFACIPPVSPVSVLICSSPSQRSGPIAWSGALWRLDGWFDDLPYLSVREKGLAVKFPLQKTVRDTLFCFILLTNEGSHWEVYQEFPTQLDIFHRWCHGLFRPKVFCNTLFYLACYARYFNILKCNIQRRKKQANGRTKWSHKHILNIKRNSLLGY